MTTIDLDEFAEPRRARIALAHLCEPGRPDVDALLQDCGPVEALRRICQGAVPDSLRRAVSARLGQDLVDRVSGSLEVATRLGARVVIPEDAEWPPQLEDLRRVTEEATAAPLCLWVRGTGNLADILERSVAVIGARASTNYGDHVATELGFGLAERGWSVVSGGAYGIDAAAHRGALAAGGPTVAVLACGIDHLYPVGHVSLFERIVHNGLLVSEWPPGTTPARLRFLIRNRVIAAMTRGTLMVEAAARSGSRATIRWARLLGRVVMAVPGPVTSALSVGTHLELRSPATRLVTNTAEVLEEVGRIGDDLAPIPRGTPTARDQLDDLSARILDALPSRRGADVVSIAASAGVAPSEVRRVLPTLVLGGLAEETTGGYRATPHARETSGRGKAPAPRLR